MNMKFPVLLLLFLCFLKGGLAIRCYTCSVSDTDIDQSCIEDPTMITNCNKKYCTSMRQEYKDPKDKVASMYRGCEDKPLHQNEIQEDDTFRVYYVACTEDLCNGGTGKASDGGRNKGSLGDKSTIYCPGTESASTNIVFNRRFLGVTVFGVVLNQVLHH